MDPSLGKLMRVLELERQQGYEDRAVIGGLGAFLSLLRSSGANTSDLDVARILERLDGYASFSTADRARRVSEALAHLASVDVQAAPAVSKVTEPAAPMVTEPAASKVTEPAASDKESDLPESTESTRTPKTTDTRRAARSPRKTKGARREVASEDTTPLAAGVASAVPETPEAHLDGDGPADDPDLDRPVVHLRGVGAKSAGMLERLGIVTIRDMLYFAPSRYNDFSRLKVMRELRTGEAATVVGTVWAVRAHRAPSGVHVLTVTLNDTTAKVQCSFFNQPYLEREFRTGRRIIVSGVVERFAGRLSFRSPEWEPVGQQQVHTGRLVPVYPLTQGLAQRQLRRQIWGAVDHWAEHAADPIPASVRELEGLVSLPQALRWLHSPPDEEALTRATRRLAVDELLVLQLWSWLRRRSRSTQVGSDLGAGQAALESFVARLPFELTAAQRRAIDEIAADLGAGPPMSRLLQGDVGSGKTVVAAAAVVKSVASGHQAVLMAPTEILAEQHFATLRRLLGSMGYAAFEPGDEPDFSGNRPPTLARLVGSMSDADKTSTKEALRTGRIDFVIGTHAVIQSGVDVPRLGLAITDEQHRFGVMQRAELPKLHSDSDDGSAASGLQPVRTHVLVMTATPIPRTLSQVLNADLDVSLIDELPPGRTPIKTVWLKPHERERAYEFIRHRLTMGEQAYVVCPRVDEDEESLLRSAVSEHERLSTQVFPRHEVGLLHGQLRPADKESAMARFRDGDTAVLVATSVIEVGVDVPNATVMLIEGADRFGLAQLHQFRGRVGRGTRDSICILLAEDPSPKAVERLETMTATTDGIVLADKDLEMRGPGDYFGLRQAGFIDQFRFARLASSSELFEAKRIASRIVDIDPDLTTDELRLLRNRVEAFQSAAERV